MSELQPFNGGYYLNLENPFPGGATFSRIEFYKYDTAEWYWRDEMSNHMGPWGSLRQAEADARATYERGWGR
jgi:hypothetical protein